MDITSNIVCSSSVIMVSASSADRCMIVDMRRSSRKMSESSGEATLYDIASVFLFAWFPEDFDWM